MSDTQPPPPQPALSPQQPSHPAPPPPLVSSTSFHSLPASTFPLESASVIRPLKRRHTSATDFPPPPQLTTAPFVAPATTATAVPSMPGFTTRPYYLNANQSTRPSMTRVSTRSTGTVQHLPTLDPTPDDDDAVFIHPPFTEFPDASKYKEGLTYTVLAANPNWFLDALDYLQLNGMNPGGTKYPSQLEPPRGWCPAKKREAKEGWADGEEPRLRCTFCRRTYAGVNAKSMWRRHVFEKHKIAMSNRRENAERKGRGSNKENKEGAARGGASTARGAAKVETQAPSQASSSRPSYRLRPAAQLSPGWGAIPAVPSGSGAVSAEESSEDEDSATESQPPLSALPGLTLPDDTTSDDFRATTPPLTPALSPSSSTSLPFSGSFDPSLANTSSITTSPYNPLSTPAFKHSPARLPSDQPWRFPSPSHPLHSSARDISLCMLAQAESSPMVRGLDVSPVLLVPKSERSKQSIFSSPLSMSEKPRDFPSFLSSKPTPRRLFSDSFLPTPLTDRLKASSTLGKQPGSPLASMSFTPIKRSILPRSTPSKRSAAWTIASPAKSPSKETGLMDPIRLDDPFTEDSWGPWPVGTDSADERSVSPPDSSPELESPVVRASKRLRVTQEQVHDSSPQDSSLGNISFTSTSSASVADTSINTPSSTPAGHGLLAGFSLKCAPLIRGADDSDSDDDGDVVMSFRSLKNVKEPSSPFGSPLSVLGKGMRYGPVGDGSPLPTVLAGKKTRRELFFRGGAGGESPSGPLPKKRRRTLSGHND